MIIHDWRDADYYGALRQEKDLRRWAWEFLRRNPNYQADFEKFAQLPDDHPILGRNNGKRRFKGYIKEIHDELRFYIDVFLITNPEAQVGETFREFLDRCPEAAYFTYEMHLIFKYHIQYFINPSLEYSQTSQIRFHDIDHTQPFRRVFSPNLLTLPIEKIENLRRTHQRIEKLKTFCDDIDGSENNDAWDRAMILVQKPMLAELEQDFKRDLITHLDQVSAWLNSQDHLVFAFDLGSDLTPQIKKVEKILKEEQKHYKDTQAFYKEENLHEMCKPTFQKPNSKKDSISDYVKYLRILDILAEYKGMSNGVENFPVKIVEKFPDKLYGYCFSAAFFRCLNR